MANQNKKPGYPGVIAVRIEGDDQPRDLESPDELEGALKVALYVWDPDGLAYVRMRQPQIAPLADSIPLDTRMDFDTTTFTGKAVLEYKGIHATHKALESDSSWLIWKYTWQLLAGSSPDIVRIEGPLEGSWTGRASLAWG